MKSLQKKSDFEKVAKFGRPFFAPEFGFKAIKNSLEYNRYGIVVSLVIDKRATVRNQIRRRLSAILRLADPGLKQGFDLMILTRPEIKELNYKEMEENLNFLLKKAGLL
jgi:ribonuclease P protein component